MNTFFQSSTQYYFKSIYTNIYFGLILSFLFFACQSEKSNAGLTTINGFEVNTNELAAKIPKGLSEKDSMEFYKLLLKQKLTEEILYKKSVKEISISDSVEKQIEQYKKQLYINSLREKLSQNVDTVVANKELLKFIQSLNLPQIPHNGFMKAKLVAFHHKTPGLEKINQLLSNANEKELKSFCIKYAETYQIELNTWQNPVQFLAKTPFSQQLDKYTNKGTYKLEEDDYLYFLYVKEVIKPTQSAPIEVLTQLYKPLLLAKRKEEAWEKYSQNAYNEVFNSKK